VYILHVSAIYMVIFREVRHDGQIHRNITEVFEPMHKYNISLQRYKINILYILYFIWRFLMTTWLAETCSRYTVCLLYFHTLMRICWFWYDTCS